MGRISRSYLFFPLKCYRVVRIEASETHFLAQCHLPYNCKVVGESIAGGDLKGSWAIPISTHVGKAIAGQCSHNRRDITE